MKEVKFRPLRRIKKTGKIVVASYMQWRKVKSADYWEEFNLQVFGEFADMPKDEFVYNHKGEQLFWFGHENPEALPKNHMSLAEAANLFGINLITVRQTKTTMKEDNNYYTATADDFMNGTEYEHFYEGVGWEKQVYVTDDYDPHFGELLKKGRIRIKKLTTEDIVSEGWEETPFPNNRTPSRTLYKISFHDRRENQDATMLLLHIPSTEYVLIYDTDDHNRFGGTLANVNELRRIMKQIGITK